jgi:threonine dehydratase
MTASLPDLSSIHAAKARLEGVVVATPLLRSDRLDALTGAQVWLKAEPLQHTGSFKYRGATNRIAALDAAVRARGVVAFSSGNHAQGVAAAAGRFGCAATIVMPSDAPPLKVARTRSHGAEVIFYNRATQDRDAIAEALAADRGATLIPPYDDAHVIAGQGTAGLEIAEALDQLDDWLVCCGGGGLAAGTSLALRSHFPALAVTIVEPEHYDDVTRSLMAGERLPIDGFAPTLCDALQTKMAGALTFPLLRAVGARGVFVTEAEVKAAMRFAFEELKLVVEPGGSVALAALLAGKVDVKGRRVAVMLSGGNVDPVLFAKIISD